METARDLKKQRGLDEGKFAAMSMQLLSWSRENILRYGG